MAKRAAAAEAGAARRVRPRAASAKAASPPVAPSAAAAATATTAAAPTAAGRTGAPAARPTRSADGSLAFVDFPVFRPRLTPEEVIRAGSFGGCYFHPRGGKPGILSPAGVAVSPSDHPAAWFASLPVARFANRRYDCAVNKYGVTAGTDQAAWERSGWIKPQDPRGWFQWYCRFYEGRRTDDDARQISRWAGVAGAKGRWKGALLNKVLSAGSKFDDASVSPVIRQTLLHWAYDITAADLTAWSTKKQAAGAG